MTRGYPIFKLRKDFPQVIVLAGDYELYEQYAKRMYAIVRRYSPCVEEYSIDEWVALIPEGGPRGIAQGIKETLRKELGMTFSVGLAPTKVLAKLASKRDKPDGCVITDMSNFTQELYHMSIEKVWGIGRQSVPLLHALGIQTVGDFARQSESWVKKNWNVNFLDLWRELRGEEVYKVGEGDLAKHKSIQKTRTFHPPTSDPNVLMSQLAKNIENAFQYARSLELATSEAHIFIKSEKFRYRTSKIKLIVPVQTPESLLKQVRVCLPSIIRRNELYRATGVTLRTLIEVNPPHDLFGEHKKEEKWLKVHEVADSLYAKYGGRVITLGSALPARIVRSDLRGRGRTSLPSLILGLPSLGEVC